MARALRLVGRRSAYTWDLVDIDHVPVLRVAKPKASGFAGRSAHVTSLDGTSPDGTPVGQAAGGFGPVPTVELTAGGIELGRLAPTLDEATGEPTLYRVESADGDPLGEVRVSRGSVAMLHLRFGADATPRVRALTVGYALTVVQELLTW